METAPKYALEEARALFQATAQDVATHTGCLKSQQVIVEKHELAHRSLKLAIALGVEAELEINQAQTTSAEEEKASPVDHENTGGQDFGTGVDGLYACLHCQTLNKVCLLGDKKRVCIITDAKQDLVLMPLHPDHSTSEDPRDLGHYATSKVEEAHEGDVKH